MKTWAKPPESDSPPERPFSCSPPRTKAPPQIDLLIDDREKIVADYSAHPSVASVVRRRLVTSDFSTARLADTKVIAIDRKTVSDLAGCCTKARWTACLDRMAKFDSRHIVVVGTHDQVANYPWSIPLPKSVRARIRISGTYLMAKLIGYALDHGVHCWFVADEDQASKLIIQLLLAAEKRFTPEEDPAR